MCAKSLHYIVTLLNSLCKKDSLNFSSSGGWMASKSEDWIQSQLHVNRKTVWCECKVHVKPMTFGGDGKLLRPAGSEAFKRKDTSWFTAVHISTATFNNFSNSAHKIKLIAHVKSMFEKQYTK